MILGPNQQQWVDMLRSGKYKQGHGCLQDKDEFCCLGVGCKVAEQNNIDTTKDRCGFLFGNTLAEQVDVIKWLNLKNSSGRINEYTALWMLNDLNCMDFKQIADFIELHADELFIGPK